MSKLLVASFMCILFSGFAHGQVKTSISHTKSNPKLDFVSESGAYRVKLDKDSKKLLLEGATEQRWAKLPAELDGSYLGYTLTTNPYSPDEWDLYFVKLVIPALERKEDLQRITILVFRSHFASLKVGGREEIQFEPDPDQIVVYGKVDPSHNLKVNGTWLRGSLPTGKPLQIEVKNLD